MMGSWKVFQQLLPRCLKNTPKIQHFTKKAILTITATLTGLPPAPDVIFYNVMK